MKKLVLTAVAVVAMATGAVAGMNDGGAQDMLRRGCDNQLIVRPNPERLKGGLVQRQAFEFSYIDAMSKRLTQNFGNITTSSVSKFGLARQTDWSRVIRGWFDLESAISGDPSRSEAVMWVLSMPYAFAKGDYNPHIYALSRATMPALSEYSIISMLDAQLREFPNAHNTPIYKDFVRAFFGGETENMLDMLDKVRATDIYQRALRMHEQVCR